MRQIRTSEDLLGVMPSWFLGGNENKYICLSLGSRAMAKVGLVELTHLIAPESLIRFSIQPIAFATEIDQGYQVRNAVAERLG